MPTPTTLDQFSGNNNTSLTSTESTILLNEDPLRDLLDDFSENLSHQIILILITTMFCFMCCCLIYYYRAMRQNKNEIRALSLKVNELADKSCATAAGFTTLPPITVLTPSTPVPEVEVEPGPGTPVKTVSPPQLVLKHNVQSEPFTSDEIHEHLQNINTSGHIHIHEHEHEHEHEERLQVPPVLKQNKTSSHTQYTPNPVYGLNNLQPQITRSPSRSHSNNENMDVTQTLTFSGAEGPARHAQPPKRMDLNSLVKIFNDNSNKNENKTLKDQNEKSADCSQACSQDVTLVVEEDFIMKILCEEDENTQNRDNTAQTFIVYDDIEVSYKR